MSSCDGLGRGVACPERRKVGSVTYQEVGEEYFKKRGLRRHAGVWSLWALGVGAVISGEFYGWNFGLGTGGFGGLAIAGVLMAIMYYGLVLFDRRDVARAPAHGRRVLLRAVGDGAVGRIPHRPGRERGVRDHAGGRRRRDGPAHAGDRGRAVRCRRRSVLEQPPVLGADLLRHLRGDQHRRDRGDDAVHGHDHGALARRARVLHPRRDLLRRARLQPVDEHRERRRRDPGRRRAHAPVRDRGDLQVVARSRSGSSWRSRRCRSRPRSPWTRVATSPGDPCGACTRC